MNYFIQHLKPKFSPQSNTDINIPRTFEICNQKPEVEMINGNEYKIHTRCTIIPVDTLIYLRSYW